MATTQDHAPPGACGYSDLAKGRVSVSMLSAGGTIGQRLQHVQQLRHVPQVLADGLRVQPATELVEVDVQHLSPAVQEPHPVAAGQLPRIGSSPGGTGCASREASPALGRRPLPCAPLRPSPAPTLGAGRRRPGIPGLCSGTPGPGGTPDR